MFGAVLACVMYVLASVGAKAFKRRQFSKLHKILLRLRARFVSMETCDLRVGQASPPPSPCAIAAHGMGRVPEAPCARQGLGDFPSYLAWDSAAEIAALPSLSGTCPHHKDPLCVPQASWPLAPRDA
eukprot:scaffold731_cov261-Pinguiococcus_pyrenoidosus.AAC.103